QCLLLFYLFFFFQAEDGIRDSSVTGVQTCALPILQFWIATAVTPAAIQNCRRKVARYTECASPRSPRLRYSAMYLRVVMGRPKEIGRASCRERVKIQGEAGSVNEKSVARERDEYKR